MGLRERNTGQKTNRTDVPARFDQFRGAKRSRTADLCSAIAALYQLSYSPIDYRISERGSARCGSGGGVGALPTEPETFPQFGFTFAEDILADAWLINRANPVPATHRTKGFTGPARSINRPGDIQKFPGRVVAPAFDDRQISRRRVIFPTYETRETSDLLNN